MVAKLTALTISQCCKCHHTISITATTNIADCNNNIKCTHNSVEPADTNHTLPLHS